MVGRNTTEPCQVCARVRASVSGWLGADLQVDDDHEEGADEDGKQLLHHLQRREGGKDGTEIRQENKLGRSKI